MIHGAQMTGGQDLERQEFKPAGRYSLAGFAQQLCLRDDDLGACGRKLTAVTKTARAPAENGAGNLAATAYKLTYPLNSSPLKASAGFDPAPTSCMA